MMARKKAPAARKPKVTRPKRAAASAAATVRLLTSVDGDLLAQVEHFARARRTTVALLVEQGLRQVIGADKAPVLPPGDVQSSAPDAGPWAHLLSWMEEQQTALTEIRNTLGDVAASLPNDAPPDMGRPARGTRIPPP